MVTKDRFEELRVRSAQLSDSVDFPVRFEEHWNNDDEPLLMFYSESEWSKLEEFLAVVEQVQQQITLLESYVEDVKLKHKQLLGSPHGDKKTKQELDSIMAAFKQLSDNVRLVLKQVQRQSDQIKTERKSRDEEYYEQAVDIRIRNYQEAALNRRFVALLQTYNSELVKYRESCHSSMLSYLQLTDRSVDREELDDIIESGDLSKYVKSMVIEENQAKQVLMELESRHEDILRLENNVRELHQIFLYTAMIIEEQGDKIDRIEFNVQNTMDVTRRARIKLIKAVQYKQKYRKETMMIRVLALRSLTGSLIRRCYCTKIPENGTRSFNSNEPLVDKRARLIYQSRKRGILEMDLLLGGFSDQKLRLLSPSQLDTYDRLINGGHNEWDIWYWVSGALPTPTEYDSDVLKMLKEFASTSSIMYSYKTETRKQ